MNRADRATVGAIAAMIERAMKRLRVAEARAHERLREADPGGFGVDISLAKGPFLVGAMSEMNAIAADELEWALREIDKIGAPPAKKAPPTTTRKRRRR